MAGSWTAGIPRTVTDECAAVDGYHCAGGNEQGTAITAVATFAAFRTVNGSSRGGTVSTTLSEVAAEGDLVHVHGSIHTDAHAAAVGTAFTVYAYTAAVRAAVVAGLRRSTGDP